MEIVIVAVVVAWIAWLVYRRSLRAAEERARDYAVMERILDRFTSNDELMAFVRSEEGRLLLYGRTVAANPRRAVLRFVQAGIVVVSLGAAFLANALRLSGESDINFVRKVEDLRYWGTAAVALGIGLLITAAVSHRMIREGPLHQSDRQS